MTGLAKRVLGVTLALAVAALGVVTAPASPAWATGVPDVGRKGSVTVRIATDGTLESGRLELTRVASFSDQGQLVLDEAFSGSGVDLGSASLASDWRRAADGLAAWADEQGVSRDTMVAFPATGSGTYGFGKLDCGLYLLRGSGLSSEAESYDCGNTLVSVPSLEGDEWVYDVTCDLKVSATEKGLEPAEPSVPQTPAGEDGAGGARSGSGDLAGTGDHTSAVPVVACVAVGCALVVLAVVWRRRK